jgi:hypothetical protein
MLDAARADALAASLDLDFHELAICRACLLFVTLPLDGGDERKIRGALRSFTPVLWDEGLALPLQAALERARRAGVPDAEAAIADIEARGPRSRVAQAAVRRLAAQQLEEMKRMRPWRYITSLN